MYITSKTIAREMTKFPLLLTSLGKTSHKILKQISHNIQYENIILILEIQPTYKSLWLELIINYFACNKF